MQNSMTIIADASFCPETKAAGYSVWLASNTGRKGFEGTLPKPYDNNVAEAMAIVNALWHGLDSGLLKANTNVLIQSDSATAIAILSGEGRAYNPQLKHAVRYTKDLAQRYDLLLRFKHVPGHTSGQDKRTRAQNKCDEDAKAQMYLQRAEYLKATNFVVEVSNPKRKSSSNYLRSRRRKIHG